MKTEHKFSAEKIITSLKKSNVVLLDENTYKGIYYDEVLEMLDKVLGTNLKLKYPTLGKLKKFIADTK